MTKRPKKRRTTKSPLDALETRQAVVLTVVWTLTVTTTFLCDIGAAVTRLWLTADPEAAGAELISGMLLFAAVVTSLLVLGLLPIVLRIRRQPPPRGYIVFAVLVSVAPLLAVAIQWLR